MFNGGSFSTGILGSNVNSVEFVCFQPLADVLVHVERGYRMEAPEGCPREVYSIMSQAWNMDPQQRPTFAHVYDRLDVIRRSPPMTAPLPPLSNSHRPLVPHS